MSFVEFIKGYEVNEFGDIYSKEKIIVRKNDKGFLKKRYKMKLRMSSNGYLITTLKVDKKRISMRAHRAVAIAFLKNDQSKPFINHIDGNKTNNFVGNLE